MIILGGMRLPIIVLVATALHFIWAFGLAIDPAANNATAIHALLLISENTFIAAGVLAIVAALGFFGAVAIPPKRAARVLLMLPQQCILIMSSISASAAMAASTFADGVIRPRWFIIVDQTPVILITIGYLLAMTRIAREPHG